MSNNNQYNILDLSNEILFIIFNKLNTIDVLYSLVDITQQFNQLVFDPFYIRNLNMTSLTMKSFYDRIYSIDNQVLDRICKNILPRISHQINELILEQYSMERVLHTNNYPQLYSVTLMDFSDEALFNYLTNNTILRKLLNEQITCLTIDVKNKPTEPFSETLWVTFTLILSLCKELNKLSFCQFDNRSTFCTFDLSSTNFKSSTLTELKINVETFDDCLSLLDGRFNCLSTLIINIEIISCTSGTIDNTKKLPKLKHFSLISYPHTFLYDNLIIPLLQRMINLEELILHLSIIRSNKNYIDGIQLYDDILIYMPRLNKFTFNIYTNVDKKNVGIVFSSNEDIQRSFKRKEYRSVASHIEIFTRENQDKCYNYSLPYEFKSRCHIYSLPHQFRTYHFLNNSFQGGIFVNVQSLVMTDFCPFEHNFFKIISQSFPLLKKMDIMNKEPQKDKQKSLSLIKFSYLIYLDLQSAHADYAEQFLIDKYCHLPCLLNLNIHYESLVLVTNNFTNDATRLTCSELTSLRINEPFVPPKNFYQYFPLL
ncbi:unnamed protein product [Rotaria magnacalcarata]|uniref:F-box domain-containing protein n=1 Tax=Rotaria magnacalcarata TaxID=392030 RepID=A0A814JNB5_9BILA|nr:unnamed protein product [Rotaria magnacalcarata]CAF3990860.1 unnamed protein product [Rotaria magnacalcarata]